MSRGPTALYQPLLWPIYGEHNDYGNIWTDEYIHVKEPGPKCERYFKLLMTSLLKVSKAPDVYNDKSQRQEAAYTPFDIENFSTFLRERDYQHNPIQITRAFRPEPLCSVIIRRDVWNALLDKPFKPSPWRQEQYLTFKEGADKYVDDLVKSCEEALGDKKNLLHMVLGRDRRLRDNPNNSFAHAVSWDDHLGMVDQQMSFDLVDGKVTADEIREAAHEIADLQHVQTHMDCLRRHWQPMIGAGSQDQNWERHIEFNELVAKIGTKVKKEWDDEYGDYEDE
jgi:hypothetical protein